MWVAGQTVETDVAGVQLRPSPVRDDPFTVRMCLPLAYYPQLNV